MANEQPLSPFQEDEALRRERLEKEAESNGFDRV